MYTVDGCERLVAKMLANAFRDAANGDKGSIRYLHSDDAVHAAELLGIPRFDPDIAIDNARALCQRQQAGAVSDDTIKLVRSL